MLTPSPNTTPDRWANQNRKFPTGSAEPGRYRASRTPYAIPFQRAAKLLGIKELIGVFPTQAAKTESCFNILGERYDTRPVPILYVAPTQILIKEVIAPKVDYLLRHCDTLWAKTLKGRKYTVYRKVIAGCKLRFAWAGSTSQLAADTAAVVIADEVDRMPADLGGEGSIWKHAAARHGSYINGLTIGISTPTEGNVETEINEHTGIEHWAVSELESIASQIWRAWQEGTRHEWAWPCHECHEYFVPRMKHLHWPDNCTPAQAQKLGTLYCPHCGAALKSDRKEWMNSRGVYVTPGMKPIHRDGPTIIIEDYTTGELVEREHELGEPMMPLKMDVLRASFWVSGICNFQASKTFGRMCALLLEAERDGEETYKGCVNLDFAECSRFGGDVPEWKEVKLACGPYYLKDVSPEVNVITMTADVGKEYIRYNSRGWSEDERSWLIDRGDVWGDTRLTKTWDHFEEVVNTRYSGLTAARLLIDSGYRTNEVYTFCRRNKQRYIPCKGKFPAQRPFWMSKQDVTISGKVIRHGITLLNFNTDIFKSWVHGQIREEKEGAQRWMLPQDVEDNMCRELVNEGRVVLPSGKIEWQRSGPNHDLDCEALQRLAFLQLTPAERSKRAAEARKKRFEHRKPIRSNNPLLRND